MAIGGAILRTGSTLLYALEFCCAAIILGIYSYFLAVLADRNVHIPRWEQAVTGLSGATVLYTILAILFTCCLGGKTFFALLGLIFNVLCCGAMIAVAVLTRNGAHRCSGNVNTPLGNGNSGSKQGFGSNGQGRQITYAASLGTACRLNKACFAVAIVAAILFLISIPLQILLSRHHKKEKRFGPSPKNNYTRGSGKFWQRNKRSTGMQDPEVATATAAPAATLAPGARDYRPSHDTAYTGSTVGAPHNGYETNLNKPVQGGYHTAPTGTYGAPNGAYNAATHGAPNGAYTAATHGATPATNY